MKKSLNNTIRGKRLVVGDENEVTSHEILVEDKDDKITLKQRGSDGNIETLSGGENTSNIMYYCTGSIQDKNTVYWHKSVPYINLLDFATGDCDSRLIKGLKNYTLTSKELYSKRKVIVQATINKDFFYYTKGTGWNKICVNIPSKGDTDIILPITDFTSSIIDPLTESVEPVCLSIGGYYFYSSSPKNAGIETYIIDKGDSVVYTTIYDAATNVLSYYSAQSSGDPTVYITIDPQRAKTLKVHYWGYYGSISMLYINGKEVDPSSRDFTIGTDTM